MIGIILVQKNKELHQGQSQSNHLHDGNRNMCKNYFNSIYFNALLNEANGFLEPSSIFQDFF